MCENDVTLSYLSKTLRIAAAHVADCGEEFSQPIWPLTLPNRRNARKLEHHKRNRTSWQE